MSVPFYVDPGLPHDSWQLPGVAGDHQGPVVEGSVGGHDGEAGLTHMAGRDITTEMQQMEKRGRGEQRPFRCQYMHFSGTYLPAIFSGSVSPDPSTNH